MNKKLGLALGLLLVGCSQEVDDVPKNDTEYIDSWTEVSRDEDEEDIVIEEDVEEDVIEEDIEVEIEEEEDIEEDIIEEDVEEDIVEEEEEIEEDIEVEENDGIDTVQEDDGFEIIEWGDEEYEEYEEQEEITDAELSDIVVCKGNDNGECFALIERAEELLPQELENKIVQTTDFIEIYVGDNESFLEYMSDKPIHIDTMDYAGITGYGYQDKTVLYSIVDEYVLLHELGHAYEFSYWYDGTQDNPSTSFEWNDSFSSEFISDYGTTNVGEFYAECFAMYYRNPELLERLCPLAYNLLEEDLGDMEW